MQYKIAAAGLRTASAATQAARRLWPSRFPSCPPHRKKKRKVAFILGGGASRGAYQAGCLKRLDEEGIVPDLVIGSSIGVCNSLV